MQLLELFAYAFHDHLRVGTCQTQHQTLHGFPLAALRDNAIAGDRPDLDLGQVSQPNRRSILHGDHDGTQILQAGDAAFAADQQHFVALAKPACAIVAVVRLNRVFHLRDRHTTGGHAHGIGDDFVSSDDTTQCVDIGNAGNGAQRGPDDPVEQAAPFCKGQCVALDGEHIHFPEGGRNRCHATRNTCWQTRTQPAQAFADLLARPIDIGPVLEVDRHIDQAIFGDRAQDFCFRDTEHLHFDRH